MTLRVNRAPRDGLAIGAFLLAFVLVESFIFGEHQPWFWSDLVDQLAPTGTIVILSVFLVMAALVAGIAALGVLFLVTFVVPRPPTVGRAVLQTFALFVVVFSMSFVLRVVAPFLVSAVQAISSEAPHQ